MCSFSIIIVSPLDPPGKGRLLIVFLHLGLLLFHVYFSVMSRDIHFVIYLLTIDYFLFFDLLIYFLCLFSHWASYIFFWRAKISLYWNLYLYTYIQAIIVYSVSVNIHTKKCIKFTTVILSELKRQPIIQYYIYLTLGI